MKGAGLERNASDTEVTGAVSLAGKWGWAGAGRLRGQRMRWER